MPEAKFVRDKVGLATHDEGAQDLGGRQLLRVRRSFCSLLDRLVLRPSCDVRVRNPGGAGRNVSLEVAGQAAGWTWVVPQLSLPPASDAVARICFRLCAFRGRG